MKQPESIKTNTNEKTIAYIKKEIEKAKANHEFEKAQGLYEVLDSFNEEA